MNLNTSLTLLADMKAGKGYDRFQEMYRDVLLSFAVGRGLQPGEADDVYQETLVVLWRIMPTFNYGAKPGKFRNFLFTIVVRKVQEAKRRAKTDKLVSLDEVDPDGHSLLDSMIDNATPQPDQAMESDWRQCILVEAWRRIRNDSSVERKTKEIFEARVFERKPAKEVAEAYDLESNAVDQIVSRIKSRLRKEIMKLNGGTLREPDLTPNFTGDDDYEDVI